MVFDNGVISLTSSLKCNNVCRGRSPGPAARDDGGHGGPWASGGKHKHHTTTQATQVLLPVVARYKSYVLQSSNSYILSQEKVFQKLPKQLGGQKCK